MSKTIAEIRKVLNIFQVSENEIRPHCILTGPSGSGKSFTIINLCNDLGLQYIEINAAQLTKEGTSGNSLSKALSALNNLAKTPTVCFVDEFDKLFISGNNNSDLAHETTNGVQNEFLKVLESETASVFGDFGKYVNVKVSNVLFIFAGAFNGQENIDLDTLREFGIKTEFLGRVGLVFNLEPLSLETLLNIFDNSTLFDKYLELFEDVDAELARFSIKQKIEENYINNTLGARMITTLIHQYFIKGGFKAQEEKKVTFQKKIIFNQSAN